MALKEGNGERNRERVCVCVRACVRGCACVRVCFREAKTGRESVCVDKIYWGK